MKEPYKKCDYSGTYRLDFAVGHRHHLYDREDHHASVEMTAFRVVEDQVHMRDLHGQEPYTHTQTGSSQLNSFYRFFNFTTADDTEWQRAVMITQVGLSGDRITH